MSGLLTGGNIANVERVKVTTEEDAPSTYVFQTASSAKYDAAVSKGTEKEQRVKNAIMGLIKTPDLVKGYDLTLTDDRLLMEIYALMNGGTVTADAETGLSTYTGPLAGAEVVRKKFTLSLYTSDRDNDGDANKYHVWTFTGCKGTPVSGSFTDEDFAKNEYKIESRPASGAATITMEEIAELPTVA